MFLERPYSDAKAGSCGRLIPNLEVRLVDDDEKDIPPGPQSRGELWIRGKSIMKCVSFLFAFLLENLHIAILC